MSLSWLKVLSWCKFVTTEDVLMSERWLFVRWQSVFVKQPSNDNVAWWLWYVLLRNMPWWWGGCSDDVLYLWLNDCCRCSVKLLWMELFVVFSTMLLSNYFCLLLVWVGMEMVLYWCVPTWLYAVVSGDVAVVLRMFVAVSSFLTMWVMSLHMRLIARRHRGGGMDECLLPCPLTSWCGVMLL